MQKEHTSLRLVLGSEGSRDNNGNDNKLVGNPVSCISFATVVRDLHGISLIAHNILGGYTYYLGFSDVNTEVLIIERTCSQSQSNK